MSTTCPFCSDTTGEGETCSSCGARLVLEDRYRLREVVRRDDTTTTYRAERLADEKTVAVKEMSIRKVDTVKALELFEREAAVLEQLNHPGIPSYYDDFSSGTDANAAAYLVREFVRGESLASFLDDRSMTVDEVREVMIEVLEILDYLHDLEPPVVHRDIRPSNLLQRADGGDVALVDFGSVRSLLEPGDRGGSTVAGTFGYMAPEQFTGRARPATDIYGLGATAAALLAGRPAREMLTYDRTLDWRAVVDVDLGLADVLDEMLEPDLEQRTADVEALRERVRRSKPSVSTLATTIAETTEPRELPADFKETYAPVFETRIRLGMGFAAAGVGFGALFVGGMLSQGDTAFHQLVTAAAFPLCMLTIGGVVWYRSWSTVRMMREVYRTGERTRGTVTRWTYDDDKKRHAPLKVLVEFEAGGETHTATYVDSDLELGDVDVGAEKPVLYAPDEPTRNLVIWEHRFLPGP